MLNTHLKIQPKYLGFKSTICSTNGKRYKYGFNGVEKGDEFGIGYYLTDFRVLDTRLGRWLSIDPSSIEFPDLSPYIHCDGNPIIYLDPDGDWGILGSVISMAVEIAGQKMTGRKWEDLDVTDILISGATGLVGGPTSSAAKFVKIYNAIQKAKRYKVDEVIKAGVDNLSFNSIGTTGINLTVALAGSAASKKYGSKIVKFSTKYTETATKQLKHQLSQAKIHQKILNKAVVSGEKKLVESATNKVNNAAVNVSNAYKSDGIAKTLTKMTQNSTVTTAAKTTVEGTKGAIQDALVLRHTGIYYQPESAGNGCYYMNPEKTKLYDPNNSGGTTYEKIDGKWKFQDNHVKINVNNKVLVNKPKS